jgi:5-methylcytosine-specific restriction protein B
MRHILLHLLRPDEFERMSSRTHKQNIVDAVADELLTGDDVPDDLDEQLLLIRQKLVELDAQPNAHNGILDFYWSPLHAIWDPGSDRPDGASDLDLLLYKKQIVLYGPPGTGKTHRTRQLAGRLIRRVALERWGTARYFGSQADLDQYVADNVHWVQLHPGYGYEEFVRGLRLAKDGSTVYVDGVLPRLVAQMTAVQRSAFGSLGAMRQWIESVFWTCKGPLTLERHGARTDQGLTARVALRLLALAAALWHNQLIGQPARHLAAYNH